MSDELKKLQATIEAQKRIAAKQEIIAEEEHLPDRGPRRPEAEQSSRNDQPDQSE